MCQYREEKSGQELQREVASLESRVREAERRRQLSPALRNPLNYSNLPQDWWKADEPPITMRPHLYVPRLGHLRLISHTIISFDSMEIFSRFAGCSGFFLDSERFSQSFYAPEPFGHLSRPSKALLSAVYLTSIALSGNATLTTHEPVFLSRVLYYASLAPTCAHPSNAKHSLQAEILIANYFFLRGHIQEGKSHIDTAMLISMIHRAHKIHKISNLDGVEVVEQWERVKGFWSTYLLDKAWSIAGGLLSSSPDGLSEETRIDAPWPLELQQFRIVGIVLGVLAFSDPL